MHHKSHRLASWIYTVLFGSVAVYHFFTLLDSEMPHAIVVRHLVFCLVDAAFAGLTWTWPRWLLIPVGLLTVQQFWSHAGHVWQIWHSSGQISWPGVLTLGGLTILVIVLIQDELKRPRT
jgi:hypothetical protein